jgi:hypothetical protein
MTTGERSSKSAEAEPLVALSRLLTAGTTALAELDRESLERLQGEALQVRRALAESAMEVGTGPGNEPAGRDHFESCRRIFAEVLRSTGEHLELLKRISARGKEEPWAR